MNENIVVRFFSFLFIVIYYFYIPSSQAVVLNVTAEFKADISKPSNNKFNNITPNSGYCTETANDCRLGDFSIAIPGLKSEKALNSDSADLLRNHVSITIDGVPREIQLRNLVTGEVIGAEFRLAFFGVTHKEKINTERLAIFNAMAGTGRYPVGQCTGRIGSGSGSYGFKHAWGVNKTKANCRRKLNNVGYNNLVTIENLSIGYELNVGDPLKVRAGNYEGEVVYTVGDGKDIDFNSENYTDNEIRIKINATVEHSFFYRLPAGSENVQLTPVSGWGSWINGGQIPSLLTKEVPFIVSSSSGFKVWMQCEHNSGAGCGLKNQATAETVPLDVKMTIPGFTSNRQPVRNMLLNTDAAGHTIDLPGQFVVNLRSKLDFVVNRPEVEKMVKAPGSNWKGAVTLIFDSEVE